MSAAYCIVGGGISGLVAAYRLRVAAGPHAEITLLDPADRLGGVLRTERVCGQPLDVGAEAFVTRRPEMPALLAELGLASRQIGTTGVRPLIYSGARLHPMPQGTLQGIPAQASAVLGLVDDATVARILDERTRPLRWRRGADPTVAELVADRFGVQVVERSVDPLLAGVYAGSAASIGLRSAVPTLAAALDRGARNLTEAVREALPPPSSGSVFGALDGGYTVLLEELRRRAAVRWAQVAAVRVDRGPRGWEVLDDEGTRWRADAVVLAVPAPRLPDLIGHIAPRTAAAARRIEVASVAVVAVALPGGTPLPQQSGVLVAGGGREEQRGSGGRLNAKAVTLSSRKWGRRGNVELVRLSFGRYGDAPETSAARNTGDEDLLAWSARDLATLFGVTVDPVDWHVHRWIDAMPQYGPGHGDLVAELRAGLPPTLAVAGGYLDGIGVPACVGAATRAVATLAKSGVAR
ncbi:protoporphyrinogen oxidase [Mycolicibacterium sp. XJ870]